MRILIGYDGSKPSDVALNALVWAGLPETGTEALVVSVADCTSPHLPMSCYVPADGPVAPDVAGIVAKAHTLAHYVLEDARESANAAAARLRAAFPGWNVRSSAVAGIAQDVLVRTAKDWDADLLCVGSHGRSAIGRLVWGSVAQHVLRDAPCSVRIGHCHSLGRTPARIVVALEASPLADVVVDAVRGRHWPAGSSARIVVALGDDRLSVASILPPSPRHGHDNDYAHAQAIVDRAQQALEAAGLRCEHVLRRAEPSHLVLEEASAYDADCVFLGVTAAHGMLDRYLFGNTAASVAAKAHCSVEVVRPRFAGHEAMRSE